MPWIKQGPGHLSTKNYEVQRGNHFEVAFTLPSSVGNSSDLTLMVESFPLPRFDNEMIELSYGNRKVKVAGVASWENGDLVVRDAISKDTEKLVRTWQKKVYNPDTDQVGWAEDYKCQGTVYEYSPDGSITRSWNLFGCWPTSVNYGELSYESNEKKTITITVAYDYAKRADE